MICDRLLELFPAGNDEAAVHFISVLFLHLNLFSYFLAPRECAGLEGGGGGSAGDVDTVNR